MEMVYGGIAAMFVGWLAGRSMRLSDVQTIVVICMAGVGCCITGLAFLWIGDIITGQSGTWLWFVTGAIGGIMGVVTYKIQQLTPWFVDMLKHNGLL